ncbi:MAG: hypothetical protein HY823_03230 [Acidobacteria bacterium]|nr:hypothetical protein [Acidobacteriota bacterium]
MDIWIPLLKTVPGVLFILGVALGLLVFLAPLFMESPTNTKATDRILLITDWGSTIAATLIGIGLLWIQLEYPTIGGGFGRSRFVIPGFFFAFAGFKTFGGASNWTMFRP